MLHDFRTKARRASDAEIAYALKDIGDTLKLYADAPADHPYARKLYAEWDAFLDERHTRGLAYRRRNSKRRKAHLEAIDDNRE